MIIVVSDTSPVRALAHLGRLELLQAIFTQVLVPPAVADELMHPPERQIRVDVNGLAFVLVQPVTDQASVDRFRHELDLGESEALALALQTHAELIFIDEAAGRARAKRLGLNPIGVLGVLLEARRLGNLDPIRPLLDRLQTELNFFISPQLRTEVLRLAGES